MRIAPELYLKRLLVGGIDRVYEIARCFRNEGISTRHNPEFSMLELYQAYATYEDLLVLFTELVRHLDELVRERFPDLTTERTFDLSGPWRRVTMRDCLAEACRHHELDFSREAVDEPAKLEQLATKLCDGEGAAGVRLDPAGKKLLARCASHGERIFALYEILAEPLLTTLYRSPDGSQSAPVFITEYPFEVSPLARRSDVDPAFTDRFEVFIDGREIANAFSELNDPDDQAERFEAQLAKAAAGDDEAMEFDHDYIRALRHGMPHAAGLGLGIDRLVMLLVGRSSIRDVLLFPLLRPA